MDPRMPLFDWQPTGPQLRDEGIARVTENAASWMDNARAIAVEFCRISDGKLITADVVRDFVAARIGQPHHFNAWGALSNWMVRQGRLIPTGRIVPSSRASNHAHKNPEYEVAYSDLGEA